MDDLSFDDLVPQPGAADPLSFDDLIPAPAPAPRAAAPQPAAPAPAAPAQSTDTRAPRRNRPWAGFDPASEPAAAARGDFLPREQRTANQPRPATVLDTPASPEVLEEGRRNSAAAAQARAVQPTPTPEAQAKRAQVTRQIAAENAKRARDEAARPGILGDSAAGTALATYAKFAPTIAESAVGLLNFATQGQLDGVVADIQRAAERMDAAKSSAARADAAKLSEIIKSPEKTPLDVLGFLATHPGRVAQMFAESLPYMATTVAGGVAAGGAVRALGQRAIGGAPASPAVARELAALQAAGASAGVVATDVGLGSSMVFNDPRLRDAAITDRNEAAALTGLGYAGMNRLTRGGAEGALARGQREGVLTLAGREAGQEFGQTMAEGAGIAAGTNERMDLAESFKEATAAAAIGGLAGAGASLLQPRGVLFVDKQGQPQVGIPTVEQMPDTPFTPEDVQALRTAAPQVVPPVAPPAPAPVPTPAAPSPLQGADIGIAAVPQGALAQAAQQALPPQEPGMLDVPAPQTTPQPALANAAAPQQAPEAPRTEAPAPAGSAGAAPAPADLPAAGILAAVEGRGVDAGQPAEAPRLQNRNRSDAGYIQQMQAIAANPDPLRLSFSRELATGAPVVLVDTAQPAALGSVSTVTTASGRRMQVQYAAVEADTLLPSNSADGLANAGYEAGAPGQMRVVAGNGRAAALQLAHQSGTAQGYVQGISQDAELHGVPAQALASMRAPVLVRIMQPQDVTADIGDESNVSGVAAKSAREVANDDARRLDLQALDFDEDGNVTPAALAQFVAAMPTSEQTGLRDARGMPTRQAQDRLLGAVFASAYEDDALLALQAQAIDPEARVVMSALAAVAVPMMRLQGAGALDIRPIVSQAAQLAVNAKRRGIKLADAAAQVDLDADPDTAVVLRMFAANSRSSRRIADALRNAAQFAYDEANKPADDMFGSVERATRAQVLETLTDGQADATAAQPAAEQGLEDPSRGQPAGRDAAGPQGADDAGASRAGRAEGAAAGPGAGSAGADALQVAAADPPEFTSAGQALAWATENRIAAKVQVQALPGGGFLLVPAPDPAGAARAELDAQDAARLQVAIDAAGWRRPDGGRWTIQADTSPPPAFDLLRRAVQAAFGIRVLPVTGGPSNGLAWRDLAAVDVGRLANSPAMLVGVTGHEVTHWLERNDAATAERLRDTIGPYLTESGIDGQLAEENAGLLRGEQPVSRERAQSEVLANVNGAMWLDPAFWQRLAQIDNGSTMRKVLYQFMRAATRFMAVARGSQFDVSRYVSDVAAVREAAVQAWAGRAAGQAAAPALSRGGFGRAKGSGPVVTPGRQDPRASGAMPQSTPTWGPSPLTRGNAPQGVRRLAPNSAEFQRWFKGSKVLDDSGNPLIVYHGTAGDFSEFRHGEFKTTDDKETPGWHFSESPSVALDYARDAQEKAAWLAEGAIERMNGGVGPMEGDEAEVAAIAPKSRGNIMPVYLSIKRPLVIRSLAEKERLLDNNERWRQSLIERARRLNKYDGIILERGVGDSGFREYIPFRPEQIKSAVGNSGAFSPDTADIRFSRARRDTSTPDLFDNSGDLFAGLVPQAQPEPAAQTTPAEEFTLTAPTRESVLAQQAARERETRDEANRRRARDEAERQARIDAEIRARMDASAENFELGQSADDALSGQSSLFEPGPMGVSSGPDLQRTQAQLPLDPYEFDLFGNALPTPPRAAGAARPDRTGVRGDAQPAAALRDTPAPAGDYYTRTFVGETARRPVGVERIRTAADAAAATRYLFRSAVERLDGIVTDRDGKPLAVIGGFKGALTQAAVYPATLMGEAVRVPGAAFVWFSHNHPSGSPELSRADEALNQTLARVFRGSGIEARGVLAVGREVFGYVDQDGNVGPPRVIPTPPAGQGTTVPVIERENDGRQPRQAIATPAQAKDVAGQMYRAAGQVPGMILLNSQMQVNAWVPLPPAAMGRLRDTGGLNALYRAVSEANAASAILVHGGELEASLPVSANLTVGQNIGAALRDIDVRTLDMVNARNGTSAGEQGVSLAMGPVFSRAAPEQGDAGRLQGLQQRLAMLRRVADCLR